MSKQGKSPAPAGDNMSKALAVTELMQKLVQWQNPGWKVPKGAPRYKMDEHLANELLREAQNDARQSFKRDANAMSENAKAKVATLIEHEDFKAFMKENSSYFLLVNGNETVDETNLFPLTYISASVYQNPEMLGGVRPLVVGYFCGMHRPPSGTDTSEPTRMMVSLLGQLLGRMYLEGMEVSLDGMISELRQGIETRDLESLGTVFEELAIQLERRWALYCIIDSVACDYQGQMTEDLNTMLTSLTKVPPGIRARGAKEVDFRLLVTTQRQLLMNEKLNEEFEGRIINLPEHVEGRESSQRVMEHFRKG